MNTEFLVKTPDVTSHHKRVVVVEVVKGYNPPKIIHNAKKLIRVVHEWARCNATSDTFYRNLGDARRMADLLNGKQTSVQRKGIYRYKRVAPENETLYMYDD